MENGKLMTLLADAEREITSLRRNNEILSAKVEMIDLFACVLHTNPARHIRGETVDVAWKLREAMREVEKDREDD